MKEILFQPHSDPVPNAYDLVVAYDGSSGHASDRGNVKPSTVGAPVDSGAFGRPPRHKKNTAPFITGNNFGEGEAVLASERAIERHGRLGHGAIGFRSFKLGIHPTCITRLFGADDAMFERPETLASAKTMIANR